MFAVVCGMHAGDATGKYSGVLDCFVKTARNDGLLVGVPTLAQLAAPLLCILWQQLLQCSGGC